MSTLLPCVRLQNFLLRGLGVVTSVGGLDGLDCISLVELANYLYVGDLAWSAQIRW
jgi:hypothetical protein